MYKGGIKYHGSIFIVHPYWFTSSEAVVPGHLSYKSITPSKSVSSAHPCLLTCAPLGVDLHTSLKFATPSPSVSLATFEKEHPAKNRVITKILNIK